MARASIGDLARVFFAAVVLGPPIGGIVVALLAQVFQLGIDYRMALPELGAHLLTTAAIAIPYSYVLGGPAAIVGGLALAAYIAWGGRLTVWTCLAASLAEPAFFAGLMAVRLETYHAIFVAGMIGVPSAAAALLVYILLRRTALVRRLNAPAEA